MKPRLTPRVQAATAVGLVVGALAAVFVPKMFSVEPAFATQGTGFTTTILSRGAIGNNVAFGTPTQLVVKRKVRIKTRRGFVTKTIRIRVPIDRQGDHLYGRRSLRHRLPAGDASTRRLDRLAHPSRAGLHRLRPGRGDVLPRRRLGVPCADGHRRHGVQPDADPRRTFCGTWDRCRSSSTRCTSCLTGRPTRRSGPTSRSRRPARISTDGC